MIRAFFHKKDEESKPFELQLSERRPYLLAAGVLLDVLSLAKPGDFEGSFDLDGNQILDEAPCVSLLEADGATLHANRSVREHVPGASIDAISRAERFVSAFCLDADWRYYLQRLAVLIVQELSGNPSHVFLDISKTRNKTNMDILVSFVSYVFPKEWIFLYAPGVKNVSGTPSLVLDEPLMDGDAVATVKTIRAERAESYSTFLDRLAASSPKQKAPELNLRVIETVVEPSDEPKEKPAKAAPTKRKNLYSKPKERRVLDALKALIKAEGSNIGFCLAFLFLAGVTPIIYFGFANTDAKDTFFVVCVLMVFLFLIMSAVPIGFMRSDLRCDRWKEKRICLIVTILTPLIAMFIGFILVLYGGKKGWNSESKWFFFIGFFLYPIIYAVYLFFSDWFERRSKKQN